LTKTQILSTDLENRLGFLVINEN